MNRSDVIAYGLSAADAPAPTLACLRCAASDHTSTDRLPLTAHDVRDLYELFGADDQPLPVCERCAADLPNTPPMHSAVGLEQAFEFASCLAGGWYRRQVTIYYMGEVNDREVYDIRPTDAPAPKNGRACYRVERADEQVTR